MPRRLLLFFFAAALLAAALPTQAQGTITVSNDQPVSEFPDRLTFRATFQNDRPIEKVVLEYGVDQWTCGAVIAKAFPDIAPGQDVSAGWTWEMKQSGSQPPGTKIWWRWHIFDDQGREIVTNRKETVWLDDQHNWQTESGGDINLHWYDGGAAFGRELHESAVESLNSLGEVTGLRTSKPIDLYIYGNTEDMREAVLYEPGWTGGLAYSDHNIVIIGITPDDMDWGKRTQAHELTHVLVGQLTFSCLSDIPKWLAEGLAVYGEGGPAGSSQTQFDQALKDDTLLPVRSLSGDFSEDPSKADISYTQSYSLVKFLIEKYGQDTMLDFLSILRDGATVDEALQQAYRFDIEGFEEAWRAAIGAQPRSGSTAKPTPTLVPTVVPTFVPASVSITGPTPAPARERPTPTPIVLAQADEGATPSAAAAESTPIRSALIVAVGTAAAIAILIIAIFIVVRRQQRRDV